MSDPESYARIPSTELKKTLEGLQKKVNSVCRSQTASRLVAFFNIYNASKWQKFLRKFGKKQLGFVDWIKMERQRFKDAGIFETMSCDFWCAMDSCNFDGLISNLERLTLYSPDVVLVCDTDVHKLHNAVAKSQEAAKAEAYLEKLEKEYPGFFTATFG